MHANTLVAIVLAALLVFAGGAAATPGQAPADPGSGAADDHRPDDPGSEGDEHRNASNASNDANVTADGRDDHAADSPPIEMPEPAPDHVGQIHQFIRDKICGCLTGQELGAAISGLVGNSDHPTPADENASERTAGATESAAGNAPSADGASDVSDGPNVSLPEQAADHVSQIHDLIASWLSGDGEGSLGAQVSATAS